PALRRGGAPAASRRSGGDLARLAEAAASAPGDLDDGDWVRLLPATGSGLDTLTATADDVRRYTVGETVSIVVNRNLTSTGFRAVATG
ncbi:hypothetical protein ABTM92_19625, partial [Acinetobacter baumannii]